MEDSFGGGASTATKLHNELGDYMDAYLSANTVDKLPELTFKRCQIPGVLESICVPIDS